jgi:predicted TIM-barrel fold metal-dependent hydrolase
MMQHSRTTALAIISIVTVAGLLHAAEPTLNAYQGPKEKLHVYLVIGGAEMAGRAAIGEEDAGVLERCYLLNDKDQWEPARNPLNRYSSIASEGAVQKLGPAYSFAKAMLEADKSIAIGLVVNAGAEAGIEQWGIKTDNYRQARRRTRIATRTGVLKGVLWQQVGARTQVPSTLDYLKDLITNLRTDHRDLNLPVVVGDFPAAPSLSAQLRALVEDVHATAIARGDGPTRDGKHLDTQGMRLFGRQFAAQMLGLQTKLAEVRPAKPIKLIDTHVHAMANKPGGLDAVAKWMDRHGIERCIVHPLTDSRANSAAQREVMLANYRQYRGRIDRFCLIEPEEVTSVAQAVAILEKEKAAGAIGMGEHYGRGLMFDDPKNLRLYAACEKVGLPVMFHIDQNKNMDERGLRRVERVLQMYPRCVLIAHASWWGHMPDGTCDRLLQQYPNLYADVSGDHIAGMLNRDRRYTRAFLIRNADKVMFGTDAGWWSFGKPKAERELQFDLFEQLDLPEEVRQKICHGNAARLFGFTRSTSP